MGSWYRGSRRVSKNEEKKHRKVFHINVKNFLFGEVINIDAILQENRPDFSERFSSC
jgi:hypothetical protein